MHSVLIVENNEFFRHSFKEIVKMYIPDLLIEEAANSDEAVRKIKSHTPDIIFMDVRLAGKSGLELTREIKACYPDIFVIIITNYDYSEYRETAYWYGADHFLLKDSLSGADIADLIHCVLGEGEAIHPAEEEAFLPDNGWCRASVTG